MWGNLLGWSISAVMVVATVGGLISLNRSLNQISPPTIFSNTSGALAAIELPSDIDELQVNDAGPANVAALYRQAISEYQANRATFDRFVRSHRHDDLLLIQPTLDVLVQASGNSTVPIFAGSPQDIINYQTDMPLTALELLGQCLLIDGLLTNTSDPKRAADELGAAFSLGVRLAREQLTYAELSDGLGLMDGAATELATMSDNVKDRTRATNYRRLIATLVDFTNQKLIPIESVLS